jgi:hypothetical protein
MRPRRSSRLCVWSIRNFGFDVLSVVLDQREKRAREREEDGTPGGGKARKRMRPSVNV